MKTMLAKRNIAPKSTPHARRIKEAAFATHATKEEFSVRAFCTAFGVTQDAFTRLAGFSPRAVAHWAGGRSPVTTEHAVVIAGAGPTALDAGWRVGTGGR